jgi:hypothetical protein
MPVNYHLICVHPFDGYEKGQKVTAQDEVDMLLKNDRGHHFVKIAAPEPAAAPSEPDTK